MTSEHDKKVEERIEEIRRSGGIVLWADLSQWKQPDIIYMLGNHVIGEDTKLNNPSDIEIHRSLPEKLSFTDDSLKEWEGLKNIYPFLRHVEILGTKEISKPRLPKGRPIEEGSWHSKCLEAFRRGKTPRDIVEENHLIAGSKEYQYVYIYHRHWMQREVGTEKGISLK